MTQDEHPKNPVEAHREGLERIEHEPHHPSTGHVKAPHTPIPPAIETPGEAHRGGPLPNQKR
jgi:hypothetical protein